MIYRSNLSSTNPKTIFYNSCVNVFITLYMIKHFIRDSNEDAWNSVGIYTVQISGTWQHGMSHGFF